MLRPLTRFFSPLRMIHVWSAKVIIVASVFVFSSWVVRRIDGLFWPIVVDAIALFAGILVLAFPIAPGRRMESPSEQ